MEFYEVKNFPKKAIPLLEKLGHTVFDIRGIDREGLSDLELFPLVKNEKTVFLTTDKDFFHTIHLTEKPHYGIIVIALRQPNAEALMGKFE